MASQGRGEPSPKTPVMRQLPRMLSVAEVADMFGRAPRTIRSWIRRGIFQPIKVGNSVFIPQGQVDALLCAPKVSKPVPAQDKQHDKSTI